MLRPRTTLLALAKDGSEVSRIENPGVWYSRVAVEGANVYLEMVRQEDGSFVRAGSDVLVRSGQKPSQKSSDLTERTLDIRGKVQYINLNLAGSQPEITTKIANRIQECDQVSDIRGAKSADSWFAYAFGRLRGIYDSAGEAITAVSEDMGWVADREGRELWHRTAKKASTMDMDMEEAASAAAEQEGAKNHLSLAVCLNAIALHEDPQIERETIISADTSDIAGYFRGVLGRGTLDLSGCTVRQVMYFLGEGKPVLAINQDGSCLLLSGCDARNVLLTDPAEEHSGKMGQNDAEAWFAANGARFYAPR